MDAGLSRASLAPARDPHDWNGYDHYRTIHDKRLAEHPFVDHETPNTIQFTEIELGGVSYVHMEGQVYCLRGVVLEVEKYFETRLAGGTRQIRVVLYRYIAWTRGGGLVLKYHNLHESPDEYIHRAYEPEKETEVLYEVLTRFQFPTFPEVLDEAEVLTRRLD